MVLVKFETHDIVLMTLAGLALWLLLDRPTPPDALAARPVPSPDALERERAHNERAREGRERVADKVRTLPVGGELAEATEAIG